MVASSARRFHLALLPALLAVLWAAVPSCAKCDPSTDPDKSDIVNARAAIAANCDCAGALTHGAYVSCAVQQANSVLVNPSCKGAVKKCAAHSTCGKPTAVTCCLTTTRGTKCKIKKDAAHCTAKQGTAGSCTSCCDACPTPGGGPSCPTWCSRAGDCPLGTACNTMTGQCESACGDASHSICHGGCCGGGTCQPGTVASACGSGGACAVCDATNPSGSACVITGPMSGHCGCTSEGDCPDGQACLLAGIYICTTECNAPNVTRCNVGCCSTPPGPPPYGTCQPGTADTACGNTGGTCVDCTNSLASCVNGNCAP